MVTNPAHNVVIFDYESGDVTTWALKGYDAASFKSVNASLMGVTPVLAQGASDQISLRFWQEAGRGGETGLMAFMSIQD
jgi:hypothetical protein